MQLICKSPLEVRNKVKSHEGEAKPHLVYHKHDIALYCIKVII